ncbi:YihY/virulence factor BrkB family protein [Halosegnis sp.]|uniref:YihY/virulence factor BrkB family protein n=1 Tax=Halosegnis sp. TaxID=2864959 RepID=UPI0035D48951
MNRRITRLGGVVRAVVVAVQSDRITFIAASLAYYAFISLLPLLLLALVAASVFGGPALAARLGRTAAASLGPEAGTLVESALRNAAGRGGATVAGTLVLLWSGLKLFRGLDVAFSTVYGTAADQTFLNQLRDGGVTLVGVALAVAATIALGVATARIDRVIVGIDIANVLGSIGLLIGLVCVFLPLYYVLSGGDVGIGEALPGAVFAALGWTALQVGFRVYAGAAGSYEAYGVLGGVLLLITFLYFGGLVLLVGVVLNAVLADRLDGTADLEATSPNQPGLSSGGSIPPDVPDDDTDAELRALRRQLAEVERRVDERTVPRERLERELKRYVRARLRRGKARGWGPYLVLLYGTVMTLGAFYLLSGGWAILAMLVVWLSTLGLYALMVLVGAGVSAVGLPGRFRDWLSEFRDG